MTDAADLAARVAARKAREATRRKGVLESASMPGKLRDCSSKNAADSEIFIVEGHTDTVGSDAANLALSDRRAESVALALTEYFQVPPENMVVQGYGEQILRVPAEGDVRENRRASIRRISCAGYRGWRRTCRSSTRSWTP